jgi:hypothetical protein
MRAFCFRNGVIGFARRTPEGAIPIAKGSPKRLRRIIGTAARHGYEPGVLLVPGIPEAASEDEALKALRFFVAQIRTRSAE